MSEESSKETLREETIYVVYRKRWSIVLIFAMVAVSNNMIWLTFSTVGNTARNYYGKDAFTIDSHALIFQIIGTIFMLGGSWLCDVKGVRFSLLISGLLNLIGAWIRCIDFFSSREVGFAFVLIGCTISAFAQPVILVGSTKLANNWFPQHELVSATGIASLSVLFGMAMSFLSSSLIVTEGKYFSLLYLIHAIVATLVYIPVVFIFEDKPPTPPTMSKHFNEVGDRVTKKDFKNLIQTKSFVFLLIAFGFTYGVFASVFSKGLSEREVGWFGVAMIFAGIFGAGIFGRNFYLNFLIGKGTIVDKFKKYKIVLVSVVFGIVCSLIYLYITFYVISYNKWIQFSALILCGFFAISALPIAMDSGVEVSYPTPEASSSGMLMLAGNLASIIFIVVMNFLQDPETKSMKNAIIFAIVCVICSFIAIIFFGGPYKRMEFEKTKKSEINMKLLNKKNIVV